MDDYRAATYGDRIAEIYVDRVLPPVQTGEDFRLEVRALGATLAGPKVAPLDPHGHRHRQSGAAAGASGVWPYRRDRRLARRWSPNCRANSSPAAPIIPVTIGDLAADVPVDGTFTLIFGGVQRPGTFFALTTQEAQVRCFRRVADHLAGGGVFLIAPYSCPTRRVSSAGRVSAVRTSTRYRPCRYHGGGPSRRRSTSRYSGTAPGHCPSPGCDPPLPGTGADPLRVARPEPGGATDGPPRRHAPARTLERLESGAPFTVRQHPPQAALYERRTRCASEKVNHQRSWTRLQVVW